MTPLVTNQRWRPNQHEYACFGVSFHWSFQSRSTMLLHAVIYVGVDLSETFAPTVSSSSVRVLSAIACELRLVLCHFDVDQALFNLTSMRMFFCVCRKVTANCLAKWFDSTSLNGLKQASRIIACSPNDVSQKTRFRAIYGRCICFSFDQGLTCGNRSSYARR